MQLINMAVVFDKVELIICVNYYMKIILKIVQAVKCGHDNKGYPVQDMLDICPSL